MKVVARVVVAVVTMLVGVLPASAQGPIVEPPDDVIVEPVVPQRGVTLELIEERVEVTVEGQMATTRVAQTFRNPSEWVLEGEYLFPLPSDAAIRDMDMTVDGKKLEGELMTAEQAREIYEEIVRRRMDPALLEWMGNGLFRTRIFPIPPGETRLIELEYTQLLTPEGGLFHYRFPLRQGGVNQVVQDVSVTVTLEGEAPLHAIYSPSHEVDIIREGERSAVVGWEGRNVTLDEDFSLFWSVSPEAIELNLLSFKERGEDGFFLLLAAPTIEPPSDTLVARDVVVVLDVSGSMEGEKLVQAKEALDYVLTHLNPLDRFNVIAFSTGTRRFAQGLQATSEVEAARRWVDDLQASGSTDISRALLEAMELGRDSERPLLLLFLTDGLPTAGVVESEEILRLAEQNAPEGIRLFTFGVGYDVDTVLLDALATEMRGTSSYVTPEERIDEEISAFYEKVSTPVLADIALDWDSALVEEVYPSPLPDLFAGQQLVVVGRYREGGPLTLTLEGTVNGEKQSFRYEELRLTEAGESDATWLPRLWATRKIGTLLQSIRLHGENPEAVEEIVDLAIRHGIVTPYTTFLVDEGADFFGEGAREELVEEAPAMEAAVSGAAAVEEAEAASDLALSERAAPVPSAPITPAIRVVGSQSFVQRDGRWIDTRYEERMEVVEVPFGSEAYFDLAGRSNEIARYLSVGVPLIVVVDDVAYEIVENPDLGTPQPQPTTEAIENRPHATATLPVPQRLSLLPSEMATDDSTVELKPPERTPLSAFQLSPLVAAGSLLLLGVGLGVVIRRRRL
ncbi:MAG: VWA domain-containing protein [Chloroflexota bacterium]|nr:VWA domain-containing protein [Chloroflexota bacterium]